MEQDCFEEFKTEKDINKLTRLQEQMNAVESLRDEIYARSNRYPE